MDIGNVVQGVQGNFVAISFLCEYLGGYGKSYTSTEPINFQTMTKYQSNVTENTVNVNGREYTRRSTLYTMMSTTCPWDRFLDARQKSFPAFPFDA